MSSSCLHSQLVPTYLNWLMTIPTTPVHPNLNSLMMQKKKVSLKKHFLPYCMCFGPDASSPQWVCLIIRRLPFFFCVKAVLSYSLIHSHVIWQQVVTNVEL